MQWERRHGGIEVITGSMFSGKTEELLRRLRRAQIARQRVQVFKPGIDTRYSADHVQSHDSNRLPSRKVSTSAELLALVEDATRVVGVDEAQFFDSGLVEVVQKLADRGVLVIVAGLDMDFLGKPFGFMPQLLAVAESVTKLTAVCTLCGASATRSQLLEAPDASAATAPTNVAPSADEETTANPVTVGGHDLYEARCRYCHTPPRPVGLTRGPNEAETPCERGAL